MATVYGTNATKALAPTGANDVSAGKLGGRKKVMIDDYTFAASASGTIVMVGDKLPKGSTILAVSLYTAALGSGVTLKVGDSLSADRYIGAASATSATILTIPVAQVAGFCYTLTQEDQIQITTGGASATGAIKIAIEYTRD